MAEGIAVEGIRLCKEYLPRAYRDGGDIEARGNMLSAAAMGATAFQKGLGAMHSLSHPCSANLGTHHGLTNAVVMPYVLVWNRAGIEEKMQRLATWLGLPTPGFDGVLDWILALRRTIGIPGTLADLGMRAEQAAAFAPQAFDDPSTGGNPVPMTPAAFEQLYRNCIAGRLDAA
jgi:alcohol dehydrogenase class IV